MVTYNTLDRESLDAFNDRPLLSLSPTLTLDPLKDIPISIQNLCVSRSNYGEKMKWQ